MPTASRSLVARLTPPGKSAIASLGIAGPRAWEVARSLFRRPRGIPLPDLPVARSVFFGSLGEAASGADDVVLFIRDVTPTFVAEINCHGGPEVIRLLEANFHARGIDVVGNEVWSALVHGPDRAAIIDVMSRCPTARTAAIALDQLNGAFDRAIAEIDALCAAEKTVEGVSKIARLRELIPVGEHLVRPWKVVVVGEPNVGKSSLVNALAGFTRSIVSPTPGTTRDVVSTTIALDGWPVELIDTAGLRNSEDFLESEGIARARAASAEADLIARVVDATNANVPDVGPSELLVVNKIDLFPSAGDCRPGSGASVPVSARTGEGIGRLVATIVDRLVPAPPCPGEGVPVMRPHRESLDRHSEIDCRIRQ